MHACIKYQSDKYKASSSGLVKRWYKRTKKKEGENKMQQGGKGANKIKNNKIH